MKNIFVIISILLSITLVYGTTSDAEDSIPAPSPCPTGLTFDGEMLWSLDRKTDQIYRINPETGEIDRQFDAPGYFTTGLAWDGKHLWISDMDFTNTETESYSGKIYQVCPQSGKLLNVIMAPTSNPQGLAWDGTCLWVSDNGDDMIYRISPEDGTTIASFRSPARDPRGMAYDGKYIWIADRSFDELYRVHSESGVVVMILPSPGPYPWGLAWSENKLWGVDYQTDSLFEIDVFKDVSYTRTNERWAKIEFISDIINYGPATLHDLNIYIAEPKNRSTQNIIDITYPKKPSEFLTDQYQQRVACFHFDELKAGDNCSPVMRVEAKIYDVMYHIIPEKVGSLADIPPNVKEKYLQDNEKYCLDDPYIQKSVKEAAGKESNPYWIARNIFDYLREKLFYERTGGWDIAPTVLKRGSGSCSEYTFVYIAMCRAAGVPARYVGSVVVRGEEACFDYVYHRWVEIYLPGYEWIPVDPSGGDRTWPRDQAMGFGHLSNRFLITTEGGGGSQYLGWNYNSSESWQADGPVQLRVEKIAEWDKVKKDEKE